VLGGKPVLGRALRASDDAVGAAPVIVLSYASWQRRFDGDRGALGVGVAAVAVWTFVAVAPPGVPRLDEIELNTTALAGAVAITVLSLLVFALTPAVTTSRVELQSVLRSDTRQSASRRSRRASELLVTAQVALALVILSSAGLIARSLIKLEGANLSFNPSHLLIGELSVRADSFEAASNPTAMLDRLLPQLQAIPGVFYVSPVVAIPFSGSHGWDGAPQAEGQSAADVAGNPMLNMEVVAPSYFATFGIPILRGRGITNADRKDAPGVVVLSQSAARHFWPHGDGIGKRVMMGANSADTLTVVGIVPDTRYRDLRDPRPSIYFPLRQSVFPTPMTLAIRTSGSPAALVPEIRRVIREAEPGVALVSAAPFDSFLAAPLAQPRLNALLLAVFASAAVVLAAIGLFGVMATMVRQRTREFGVRMALGADADDVLRMVMRRGLAIAAPGIAIGLLGALFANRLLSSLLYEVSATDTSTLAAASALLLLVASAASLIPARSTARIDPTEALRAE
jgi:putative ABC transport system permease protein